MEGDAGLGDAAAGVDELVEALGAQELAVDDAHGAHLDDLVAAGRVEAGRLGVEDGEGERRRAGGRPARGRRRWRRRGRSRSIPGRSAAAASASRPAASGRRKRKKLKARGRSWASQSSPPCRSATSRGESGAPGSHRLGLPAGRDRPPPRPRARPGRGAPSRRRGRGAGWARAGARRRARKASAWVRAKLSTLSQRVSSISVAATVWPASAAMRWAAAVTRSAPSISCSGQRVRRSSEASAASAARRALMASTSSRTTAWKRSRSAGSRSG